MSAYKSLALGLALVALGGCKDLVACDEFAAFSVTVTVEGPDGTAITDAVVTYTVDGGAEEDCMESSPAGSYVCGTEEAGDFEITAGAPGFDSASGEVTVEADECHVLPQALTLVLPSPAT